MEITLSFTWRFMHTCTYNKGKHGEPQGSGYFPKGLCSTSHRLICHQGRKTSRERLIRNVKGKKVCPNGHQVKEESRGNHIHDKLHIKRFYEQVGQTSARGNGAHGARRWAEGNRGDRLEEHALQL